MVYRMSPTGLIPTGLIKSPTGLVGDTHGTIAYPRDVIVTHRTCVLPKGLFPDIPWVTTYVPWGARCPPRDLSVTHGSPYSPTVHTKYPRYLMYCVPRDLLVPHGMCCCPREYILLPTVLNVFHGSQCYPRDLSRSRG